MTAAVEVDGVTKRYGSLVAVDDLSFVIEAGESWTEEASWLLSPTICAVLFGALALGAGARFTSLRTLNSGGILPLVLGIPALLGVLAVSLRLSRRRTRRIPTRS